MPPQRFLSLVKPPHATIAPPTLSLGDAVGHEAEFSRESVPWVVYHPSRCVDLEVIVEVPKFSAIIMSPLDAKVAVELVGTCISEFIFRSPFIRITISLLPGKQNPVEEPAHLAALEQLAPEQFKFTIPLGALTSYTPLANDDQAFMLQSMPPATV